MKRFFSFIAYICIMMFAVTSSACKENGTENGGHESIAVTGVVLNKTSVKLAPEATCQLTATVVPENADNKAVAWSSSKEEVATVSNEGLVTAVADGEAIITVTTEDGAKTATCKIKVETGDIAVESIAISKESVVLQPQQTEQLEVIITPSNATDQRVKWKSSNWDVVDVDRNTGVVKALVNGEATITATSFDGDKTATCVVKVVTPVESITLSSEKLVLIPGAKENLVATILPATASDKSIEWTSSNQEVVTVENGEVTAIAAGEATITASADNGAKTATCAVEVKAVDSENPLKVISFNITVSNGNLDNQDNYWNNRKDVIIKFINTEKPDVMGLQEVTAHQLTYLKNNLTGYDHYGIDRGGSNNGFERTSIMYNTVTVEVVDKGTFWLSATPDTASKSWNDAIFAPVEGTPGAMKYHRTCTWMKFKRKADGKVFFYYNTHLEFGYHANYNLGQTAREKGVALIVERVKAKATNGEAVIFGGDMNQVANDKCFNPLFSNGFASGRVTATEVISEQNRNSITWNDYDASNRDKQENNNYSPNSFNMIDHFFLKNCNAMEFRTIRDTNYGGELKGKDNGSYMADHFPILITVAM